MKPETVSIIVIGYNQPKLERACLKAVLANTSHPYHLIYFDNYNSGYTLTQIWNKMIFQSAMGEAVCLLNNDTEVHPGWLSRMYESLGKTINGKLIGFVGPSTNQCHSPQKTIPTYEEAQTHAGELEVMAQPISGFCLLFSYKLFQRLKGFDERYTLYGQESDLVERAAKQFDVHCGWRKDAFVYHHGEASVKASHIDVETERKKAKDIYWGSRR